MGLINFYNKFHKQATIQGEVINKRNFTYRIVLSVIGKETRGRKGLSILDFGCGVGATSLFLANRGNLVTGIDISNKAIKLAEKSAKFMKLDNLAKFYTLNTGKKTIKKKKFDLIICIEVIEHIQNDKGLILFLSKHLKKSGVLVVSTPCINAPLHKLGLTGEFDKRVGHLRRYNSDDLIDLVNNSGLRVKRVVKTEGIIRNSLFLFPLLGKFIKFIRGPISDLVTLIDNLTVPFFGESDIFIVSSKA